MADATISRPDEAAFTNSLAEQINAGDWPPDAWIPFWQRLNE